MVFQDVRLLDHLSAFDNVALPLRINGGQDDQIGGFVSEMLVWLGLSGAIEAKPPNLSMGQRQLIAVARAVIVRPNLLLCDEPTSNLDTKLARRLMHLFTQLRKLGTTVVRLDPQRGPGRALSPSDPAPRRGPPEGAVRRRPRRWPRPTERGAPMNLRRLDLPLDQTAVGRFLPWTVAALVYWRCWRSRSRRSPTARCASTACARGW